MKRNNLVILSAAAVIIVILVGTFLLQNRHGKDTGYYKNDPRTGEELFTDPNQNPESVGQSVSLLGAESLYGELGSDQFVETKAAIDQWCKQKSKQQTDIVYIKDKQVTRQGNKLLFVIDTEPTNLHANVIVYETRQGTINAWFDGKGPYNGFIPQ